MSSGTSPSDARVQIPAASPYLLHGVTLEVAVDLVNESYDDRQISDLASQDLRRLNSAQLRACT